MNAVAANKSFFRLSTFRRDAAECWESLPDKGLFVVLLAAWVTLFQFFGNSTLGYTATPSLFGWLNFIYTGSVDEKHGSWIPWLVLALFWWKRKALQAVPKQSWWPGLLVLVAALVLHVLGYIVQQTRVSVVAFFLGLYGIMGLLWGRQWLRASFFPFFLFGFCVPVTAALEPATVPLRLFVAQISAGFGSLLGIDVVCEGTQLFNPSRTFAYEVAAACSGVRSLMAIIALSTVYSFVAFGKHWQRAALIVSAVPLAIIANIFRMVTIVVAAEMFGQNAGNYVHEGGPLGIFSLLPYVPAMLGLWLVGGWIHRGEKQPKTREADPE